jgi:hypothetical protein
VADFALTVNAGATFNITVNSATNVSITASPTPSFSVVVMPGPSTAAIQAQVDQLVIQGDSSVEAAQARVDADGTTHATLKARCDNDATKVRPVSAGGLGFDNLDDFVDSIIDRIHYAEHPPNSLYWSVDPTSPATLFGGTWVRIEDTFLLAAGSTYAAGATGGEATHILTESEMPAHTHQVVNAKTSASGTSAWGIDNSTGQYTTSTSKGGGLAHNNMPPYLAVYVWKRTA